MAEAISAWAVAAIQVALAIVAFALAFVVVAAAIVATVKVVAAWRDEWRRGE